MRKIIKSKLPKLAEFLKLMSLGLFGGLVVIVPNPKLGLLVIGLALMAGALAIEFNSQAIWNYAKFREKKEKTAKRIFNKLTKPSEIAFKLNVFLVLPLVFAVGLVLAALSIAMFLGKYPIS